jgi:hypothetical protein
VSNCVKLSTISSNPDSALTAAINASIFARTVAKPADDDAPCAAGARCPQVLQRCCRFSSNQRLDLTPLNEDPDLTVRSAVRGLSTAGGRTDDHDTFHCLESRSMKLPNLFKIIWWLLLFAIITWFLYERYPDLVRGHAAAVDVFVFLIWVALALAPLFQEISFFGIITLKQEFKKLQAELGTQISTLRSEIHNAVQVRTEINYPPPVSDAQLPQVEERIQAVVAKAIREKDSVQGSPDLEPSINDDAIYLFRARYSIERELRRIWTARFGTTEQRRPMPAMQTIRALINSELLDPSLANAIREVYSVCSPAIHGEEPSAAQVKFVRDVLPKLLLALRSIQ